jgi:hypothetical protein
MEAMICTVTVPPPGMDPFQLTVLAAVVTVPLLAMALTRLKPAGSASSNSGPALFPWAAGPLFEITKVLVIIPPSNDEPEISSQSAVRPGDGTTWVTSVALTCALPGGRTDTVLDRIPVDRSATVPAAR